MISSKYKVINDIIWGILKTILILIVVALSLYLVKSNEAMSDKGEVYKSTASVIHAIVFFICGFGVINLFKWLKNSILMWDGKSITKDSKEYYKLKIHVDMRNEEKICNIIKINSKLNQSGSDNKKTCDEDKYDNDADDSSINKKSREELKKNLQERIKSSLGLNGTVDGDLDSAVGSLILAKDSTDGESYLDRVQGIDELKADIKRIIDSIKNPDKYRKLGAKPTKGVLLVGPPGTGKTMLAKAIAHDANVNFIYANGSEFIEKYVGVGAKRVRDLFGKAKENTPCIVFIDEIDAVGNIRSDSNNESVQTINAFLNELDGFNENEGVLVIAATNRMDSLDRAFMRAGRFDLKLTVALPDKDGRKSILNEHAKGMVFTSTINFDDIVSKTVGFSGADLANLLNESALIAAYKDKSEITDDDVDDAYFKILMNGNKKKFKGDRKTLETIAWHESGHTLAIKLLTHDSVSSVTIVGSTSGAGGVTFRNQEEKVLVSKLDIENNIKTLYAGRAAEEIFLGNDMDITTGASADIRQATEEIKKYIEVYGMGDKGLIDRCQFGVNSKGSLDEASEISGRLYKDVLELLKNNKGSLNRLATELLNKEVLYENDIDSIIKESR